MRKRHLHTGAAWLVIVAGLVLGLLASGLDTPVRAQDDGQISLNERKMDEINSANPQPTYTFSATANQEVTIDVTALTPQLALSFSVENEAGALLVAVGNPSQQPQVRDTIIFPQAGNYRIVLSNVSDVEGEYILSVLEPESTGPVTPLNVGQPQQNDLVAGSQMNYGITARPDGPLVISLQLPPDSDGGLDITLQNGSGQSLSFISSTLLGGQLVIPPGSQNYVLRVSNNRPDGGPVSYRVSLQPPDGQPDGDVAAATPTPPPDDDTDDLPSLPTSGPCQLATQGQIVNVRAGPDTEYDQITTIGAFTVYEVLGRNEDNTWLQIDADPEIGWVSRAVTRQGGDCDDTDLPVQSYPPLINNVIRGVVYHDECAPPGPDDDDSETPPGCIDMGGGVYAANGTRDAGEPGLAGVEVVLHEGACPGEGTPHTTTTNSNGVYVFEDLSVGDYCVSVTATDPPNDGVLIPGEWTQPRIASPTARYNLTMQPDHTLVRNFGWDYQFAP